MCIPLGMHGAWHTAKLNCVWIWLTPHPACPGLGTLPSSARLHWTCLFSQKFIHVNLSWSGVFFLYIYKDILITTWFIKKCSLLCLSPTIHKQPRLLDHEGVLSFPLWIISCFLYLKSCWNWFIKCIMDFWKHWIIYKAHSHVSQNHVGFCNST
jgi:hypothetical protein